MWFVTVIALQILLCTRTLRILTDVVRHGRAIFPNSDRYDEVKWKKSESECVKWNQKVHEPNFAIWLHFGSVRIMFPWFRMALYLVVLDMPRCGCPRWRHSPWRRFCRELNKCLDAVQNSVRWSVVAEWLGLSTRWSWVRIPAKARRGICGIHYILDWDNYLHTTLDKTKEVLEVKITNRSCVYL
jgi:hypothetical protein